MADPKRVPLGPSVASYSSPASSVAEVSTTAWFDQHILGLAAQGEAPIQWQALKVNGKSRFRQILEDQLQHSLKKLGTGEFARGDVP